MVGIERDNKADFIQMVDMSNSGFDRGGQNMSFEADVYLRDKTSNDGDYAQVTYCALDNRHCFTAKYLV